MVAAGLEGDLKHAGYLDDVSSMHNLLADRLTARPRRVHELHPIGNLDTGWIIEIRWRKTTGGRESHRGNLHPWTWNQTVVDSLLHVDVAVARTVALHIAYGRETKIENSFGIDYRTNCLVLVAQLNEG